MNCAKGKFSNSFSILSETELSSVANVINISLGSDEKAVEETCREISKLDSKRKCLFNESCVVDGCTSGSKADTVLAVDDRGSRNIVTAKFCSY